MRYRVKIEALAEYETEMDAEDKDDARAQVVYEIENGHLAPNDFIKFDPGWISLVPELDGGSNEQ